MATAKHSVANIT